MDWAHAEVEVVVVVHEEAGDRLKDDVVVQKEVHREGRQGGEDVHQAEGR